MGGIVNSRGGMKKFFINKCSNLTGPSIFGHRLKFALEYSGFKFSKEHFDYNICFSYGRRHEGSVNLLRLDGLYYDIENTLGNTDKLNAPIKKAYRSFDRLIFQSKYGRDLFFSHFGPTDKPYTIICNGVPASFSSDGEKCSYPWSKVLICSASWREHKRLSAIVAGFKKFVNDDVGLVVLGECKNKIHARNVKYLGNISPQNLPFYLRGADAMVHLTWLDCCSNSVVEAIACGLPVLHSSNGGTKEIVKDSGIMLSLENPYTFNKIALYKPPIPDADVVFKGMQGILEFNKKIYRPDLLIENTVGRYIEFMEKTGEEYNKI
jgi:glycosyltransferase involved in cell wall biosynthesis